MTSTEDNGQSSTDDYLGDSWVNVSAPECSKAPSPQPPFTSDMQKMLWEAQREPSNPSSMRSSQPNSRRSSPKSPPNSPNNSPSNSPNISPPVELETSLFAGDELRDIYINYPQEKSNGNSEWILDWSSRPDNLPPKEWKFKHPKGLSVRNSKVMKRGLFSTEVLSIMLITNLVSFLLGAGLGMYIGKRMSTISNFALD